MDRKSNKLVKDFMVSNFETIKENDKVESAIKKLVSSIVRKSGYKTESIMVVDKYDNSTLVGIITIFDLLYHLRPSFLHYGFHGDFHGREINWNKSIPGLIEPLKKQKINQIMSRNIVSAKPKEHIMSVVDSMIKNKYRRLPVIDESKLIGVIYFADVYSEIFG